MEKRKIKKNLESNRSSHNSFVSLKELCEDLSISLATGKNWIKLGKIVPNRYEGKTPLFLHADTVRLKEEITSGKRKLLRSRRNKMYVSGNSIYNSYVSPKCKGKEAVSGLLKLIDAGKKKLSFGEMRLILASCAVNFFAQKNGASNHGDLFLKYIRGEISFGIYDELIDDLIFGNDKDRKSSHKSASIRKYDKNIENDLKACREFFTIDYPYETNEDILGLLYLSCRNIGNRKHKGAYFTPTRVVKKLVGVLDVKDGQRVLDPCCGTGNFLLQLSDNASFEQIYGNDLDILSVLITRINMALKFPNASVSEIKKHITSSDYLESDGFKGFDHIIGNPPWGYVFSKTEAKKLQKKYVTARRTNIESYDVFVEKALSDLKAHGKLSFVLPEAILNVRAHAVVRKLILENGKPEYLAYLGEAFDKVQCPSIILKIEKEKGSECSFAQDLIVDDGRRVYKLKGERDITSAQFNFLSTDEEYRVIDKLKNGPKVMYLKDNADFALGIVTGNNRKFISEEKRSDNERVLKGADIQRFRINAADRFITFKPESFQQVAQEKYYRAKEKLFYRFISDELIFAYDDKQLLSLNSCNILIPHIKGMPILYVLGILNSSAAQFFYKKEFNSVKILRSHIESIPIPASDKALAKKIVAAAKELTTTVDEMEYSEKYGKLDELVFDAYGLNEQERKLISDYIKL